jgi:uncharacterized protein
VDEQQFALLREAVFSASTRRDSYHHGERHWRAVAHAGLQVAPSFPNCRPLVILLFALFHDAMRENEYHDPDHGLRGAELSRRIHTDGLLQLEDPDGELLYEACRDHDRGLVSDDPTIGASWDADRLNLWRVGHEPDPRLLSTAAAREPGLIQAAASFHDGEYDWDDLTQGYLRLESS